VEQDPLPQFQPGAAPVQPRRLRLCGGSCFAYNRYYKYKRLTSIGIAHKSAYLCTRKQQFAMHSAKSGMSRCANPEITAPVLEESVFRRACSR